MPSSIRTSWAGAAFTASIKYRLLKPISSPWPSPAMGQRSKAEPMAVLEEMAREPSSNLHRRGLFSLSLIMREARSMDNCSIEVSTYREMGLFWGMVWR